MPKIKTLLTIGLVMALSISLLVCVLKTSSNTDPEITAGPEGVLPEWLFADHRSLSADSTDNQNDLDNLPTDDVDNDEDVVPSSTEPEPAQSTPSSPTPAASQPAVSVSSSAVPRWQQPGTMEFISKIQLDEKVARYKRFIANNDTDRDEFALLKAGISEVCDDLGINPTSEYGITISTSSTPGSGDWFYNMESPTNSGAFSN